MAFLSSIQRAVDFIRRNGLGPFPARILQEIKAPSTSLGRGLHPVWRAGRNVWTAFRYTLPIFDEWTLVAFYDLEVLPITFDFGWFLVAAELERRRLGLASLQIVIVAGRTSESGPENKQYLSLVDGPARRQRVFDLLIPLAELMPSITGVNFIADRAMVTRLHDSCKHAFPETYCPTLPLVRTPFPETVIKAAKAGIDIPSLRAPQAARDWVERWRKSHAEKRPLVTITLRDFAYEPGRNSNLAAWAALTREVQEAGFCVVIIPDTHRTLDRAPPEIANMPVLIQAGWNVALRAALYETAYLNLGVNNGPMVLNWLNRACRYVTFKMISEDEFGSSRDFQLSLGIDVSAPFPFATPFQKLCVEPDDLPILRREFAAMHARINAGVRQPAAPTCT